VPFKTYNFFVLTEGDNPETHVGLYTVNGVTQSTTNAANVNFGGTFIEGQNYTGFYNLTAPSITLDATPDDVGANPRAPVNGVVIEQVVPEPPTFLLALTFSIGLVGYVWRRHLAANPD
jgi:hypothetical protein